MIFQIMMHFYLNIKKLKMWTFLEFKKCVLPNYISYLIFSEIVFLKSSTIMILIHLKYHKTLDSISVFQVQLVVIILNQF